MIEADRSRVHPARENRSVESGDLQCFAVEQGVRTGARRETTDEVYQVAGRLREIERAVRALEGWRVAALVVLLRHRFELTGDGARKHLADQLGGRRG